MTYYLVNLVGKNSLNCYFSVDWLTRIARIVEYHPGCELARYSRVIYYISTMTVLVDIYIIYIYMFFSIRKRDFSASYIDLLGDIYQVLVRHQVVDVLVNQASGKISKFDRLCKQNAPTVPSTCSHAVGYFHFCAFCWPGRQAFGKLYFLNGTFQCQVFTFHADLRGWNILWCCMWGKIITKIVCVFNSVWSQCISTENKCHSLRWRPHHNLQAFIRNDMGSRPQAFVSVQLSTPLGIWDLEPIFRGLQGLLDVWIF